MYKVRYLTRPSFLELLRLFLPLIPQAVAPREEMGAKEYLGKVGTA